MSNITHIERLTQNRVIRFFTDILGYRYLGDFKERANNSNVEPEILEQWLANRDVSPTLSRRGSRVRAPSAAPYFKT